MIPEFISYVEGELEEIGEIPLFNLIPLFLKFFKNKEIEYPISNIANYEIEINDFSILSKNVQEMITKNSYSIQKYIPINDRIQSKVKDTFVKASNIEEEKIFKYIVYWINPNFQHYFLVKE